MSRTARTTMTGGAASRTDGRAGLTLVAVGPGLMRSFALSDGQRLVIGRDEDCEVRLEHARVSRHHAELTAGERPLLKDLGSRNGTAVGGKRLAPRVAAEIAVGDSVTVGPFTLVLVAEAQAAGAASTLVVEDPAARTPPAFLRAVAQSPLAVLIQGETGAGKEVLAETLHRLSGRSGQLVRLNCAGLQAGLLESELFGHERGAFTGAVAAKPGLLEVARGGTVLLDEIGELPLLLQARLLRAIEAREVLRVGGTRPIEIDVRFVAATNRDLAAEIAAGGFRLDLYYRLAVLSLHIPPLRERAARIPALAQALLTAAAGRGGDAEPPRLSPAALARLQQHRWPGNVRELRNVLERALILAAGGELRPEHLAFDRAAAVAPVEPPAAPPPPPDAERERIVAALADCGGNQTRAAELLGMARTTLSGKMVFHRIRRPRG